MEKASRAIRRSGVKLLNFGNENSDLNVIVSDVRDVRNSAKSLMEAQNLVSNDLMRWAAKEENRAIQDVINNMSILSAQWTDVQKEFIGHLKEYRQMYEMILEGEKHVAHAKQNLAGCEQKELKTRKELKKAVRNAPTDTVDILNKKLAQAERAKDLGQVEVRHRIRENEATKLIRLKEGLLRISEAYMEFGHKCSTLFQAQRDLALLLPDVHGRELEEVKYTGAGTAQFLVDDARQEIKKYRRKSHRLNPPAYPPPCDQTADDEPPPPYYPDGAELLDNSQASSEQGSPQRPQIMQRRSFPMASRDMQEHIDNSESNSDDELSTSLGAAKLS